MSWLLRRVLWRVFRVLRVFVLVLGALGPGMPPPPPTPRRQQETQVAEEPDDDAR